MMYAWVAVAGYVKTCPQCGSNRIEPFAGYDETGVESCGYNERYWVEGYRCDNCESKFEEDEAELVEEETDDRLE